MQFDCNLLADDLHHDVSVISFFLSFPFLHFDRRPEVPTVLMLTTPTVLPLKFFQSTIQVLQAFSIRRHSEPAALDVSLGLEGQLDDLGDHVLPLRLEE